MTIGYNYYINLQEMKNPTIVLVFTMLSYNGVVRSNGNYSISVFAKGLVQNQQKYPLHVRSPRDTYKWDRGPYGYGLPEILNPPPIYDYSVKEHRRYPKEVPRPHNHGYNYFGPEYDSRENSGNRFEYPRHPHLVTPEGDYWPAWDSKTWSHNVGAFPYPDPERFKVSRFPFSPPEAPLRLTSSPLSDMKTQSCIKSCPSTSEYNPVCGTDGVTYDNPGKLECAKYCGVDVELQRRVPCYQYTTTTQPPTDTKLTTIPPMETQPSPSTQPPITTSQVPLDAIPSRPPDFVENDPFADRLVFVSTESPDKSEEDFDIDIRSRNLRPDDEIVFQD